MILLSEILKNADFFKGISLKSRELLAEICIPKNIAKNETLFAEGDAGFAVYICGKGSIQLSKLHPSGKETFIKIIEQGEMFGEVILFEHDTYPVNATALNKALVYVLPKNEFHGLLNNEYFRNDFIRMLMKKQRYLADQIHNLSTYSVKERFLKFIKDHYGEKKDIEISLSKKDIASAVGTTPETLSRVLANLKKSGRIIICKKKIYFTD